MRKQRYRTKAQYLAWLRAKRKGVTISQADLEKADELAKLNPSISDKIAADVERKRRNKTPPE